MLLWRLHPRPTHKYADTEHRWARALQLQDCPLKILMWAVRTLGVGAPWEGVTTCFWNKMCDRIGF